MKLLCLGLASLYLAGCTTTKVVVVTVVTKANKENAASDYYEGVMDKKDIKKLLNDTIDGSTPEKPDY